MEKITYKKGDVLTGMSQARILTHVVNNCNGFGKGFAANLARKHPQVKKEYHGWFMRGEQFADCPGDAFRLGNIQPVTVSDSLTVINMLAQNGYKSKRNPRPLDYAALAQCLVKVRETALAAKRPVVMPKIGTGWAGGDWTVIEKLIVDNLCNAGVEVICFEL